MSNRWESDESEKTWCLKKWAEAIELSDMTKDEDYMKAVFDKINDAKIYSEESKSNWKFFETSCLIASSAVSFCNVVAATCSKWDSCINLIAAFIAATLSVINGVRLFRAYKETWLRQSKFRSELVMECLRFAGGVEKYADTSADACENAKRKIQSFKEEITRVIGRDYKRFFQNMSKD